MQDLDEFKRDMSKRFRDAMLAAMPKAPNQERKRVLELNQSMRDAQEQMGHLDMGTLVLSIPELDYAILIRRFPELNAPDAETQKRAWEKFLRDPRSAPYRVRRNDGKTPAQVRRNG